MKRAGAKNTAGSRRKAKRPHAPSGGSGYAEPELKPERTLPKAPGEGGPFEHQNNPRRKPGRQNG
jgi:hypothetical protein